MLDPEQLSEVEGRTVVGSGGEQIGTVAEVFLDSGGDRPTWLAIESEQGRVLAPLDGARLEEEAVVVDHPADLVRRAPGGAEEAVLPEQQSGLYAHYGLHDAELREDTGRPADMPDPG